MNVAQMQMLLFNQLQQMNASWQNVQTDQTGLSGGTGVSGNSNELLFVALLQAALGGGANASQGFTNQAKNLPATAQVNSCQAATTPQTKGNVGSLEPVISSVAQKYGVDPALIHQVVKAESDFDSKATSQTGAMGLMQLMPETAASYGVQNAYDTTQNLDGGTHFLKDLLNRYQGNVPLSLAAYNAGPGAVEKYNGVPPYKETQAYVQKIMAGLNQNEWKA